ncbi:alpha/beta hydrolase [Rhodococcus sp. G-MC3]|uniref:alpha/beta hydrolase n=1 Tax=Rhodococcus sp. G-MC3 TaxID=3046209 RepID=UPI0024BB58F5|nr:alpha/beta hydrolase [Rhodococcus sp. G-MC3]MDJ0394864.1 alpha/beta hydrolase [Rhodococcus sp. G-MC3]
MMLDAESSSLLDVLNAEFPAVETMSGPQARAAVRARLQIPSEPEYVAGVSERTIPGPDALIPIRIYWPAAAIEECENQTAACTPSLPPIIVFAHGGGFVFCDLDTHDGFCRAMANGVGAIVVSVGYRPAPETRWPGAAEDVYATLVWAAEHASELCGDATRLVVAGDSAGGNLAAVAALLCRDRCGPPVTAQLLIYPVITPNFDTASYLRYATGFFNTRARMQWYWNQYLPIDADRAHPYVSPIHAELIGLPPAVLVSAGHDPLRSEGDSYAQALAAASVPVNQRCYEETIHGFMTVSALAIARRAQQQTWTDLGNLL